MLARSSGMAWHGAEIPPIPCNIHSGVKKNKKRGADNHWQPKFRKDNNGPGGNGSAGPGAGAGAPASV